MESIKNYKPYEWVTIIDPLPFNPSRYLLTEDDFYGVGRKSSNFFENKIKKWTPQDGEMVMIYSIHNPNMFVCGEYNTQFLNFAKELFKQTNNSENICTEPYIGNMPIPLRKF